MSTQSVMEDCQVFRLVRDKGMGTDMGFLAVEGLCERYSSGHGVSDGESADEERNG
jgi:hypothetical protein